MPTETDRHLFDAACERFEQAVRAGYVMFESGTAHVPSVGGFVPEADQAIARIAEFCLAILGFS